MYAAFRLNETFAALRLKVLALLLVLLTGMIGLATASHAENFGEADIAAFRKVIESQIKAFRSGDAESAYEFASPEIKAVFPTPEMFMAMVRQGYGPVYRAENYTFEDVSVVEGQIIQPVRILQDEAAPIIAMYVMERQPDGAWKIGGCILLRESGHSI